MVPGQSVSPQTSARDELRVVIEVTGANVVVRATSHFDKAYTRSLAGVINAASDIDTCVVIDPEPIRCDDAFAAYEPLAADRSCSLHRTCRPVEAEVAMAGVVRLHAEGSEWLIDVSNGRICEVDVEDDVPSVGHEAWRPVVAVCVTPTQLIGLSVDGTRTSATRARLVPHAQTADPPVQTSAQSCSALCDGPDSQ